MRVKRKFLKMVIYFIIIISSSLIAIIATEIILTKNKLSREFYLKKIDPEPYVATTNTQGFRVKFSDLIYQTDPDSYFRIICLGDSFTYGHGVADDKTYPVFLEQYLKDTSKKIQVINAGVCGANIKDELDMYVKSCSKLKSDLVIFLYHYEISKGYKDFLSTKIKKWDVGDKYLKGSKIYTLIKLKILQEEEKLGFSYYNKHREYFINQFFESMRLLNRAIKNQNSSLIIVIFNPDMNEEGEIIEYFCKGENITFIDIRKEYNEEASRGGILLAYHHNERGNAFLARLITQQINTMILKENK